MCRVVYDQCRFCEREKLVFVNLYSKGRSGDICIDYSFRLSLGRELVDDTAHSFKATVVLRHVKRRYTCSAYKALTTRVICVIPTSIATKDIDTRPAFTWLCYYYYPALLDAIYTAATSSLAELQHRLRHGDNLLL
jgi:phage tail protein X